MMSDLSTKLSGDLIIAGGPISLWAQIGGSSAVKLQGRGKIHFKRFVDQLLGGGYLKLPDSFPDLEFDSAKLEVVPGEGLNASADTRIDWKNPFGILKGVTVKEFRLDFSSGGAQATTISFATKVDYGGQPKLRGSIHFKGGGLEVVALELNQTLGIATFLDRSVPGVNWGELMPISFEPESHSQPMRLYYAKEALGSYKKDLHIDRTIITIFDYAARVTLNVSSGAVTVTGQLKQPIDLLDLGFLTISGPGFKDSPLVSVSTSPRRFVLKSAYTFLREPFGSADLTVQRIKGTSDYEFRAKLAYDGKIGPFKDPSFSFTWSKDKGFHIDDWNPPETLPADIKLLKMIQAISEANGCGALVDLIFRAAVTTRFKVKPSFVGREDGLYISLQGSYNILLSEKKIVSVDFPSDIEIPIKNPRSFSFADISKALIQGIEDNAKKLVLALMNDPKKAAKFFIAVVAPKVLKKIASELLCNGIPNPKPPNPKPPNPKPPNPAPQPGRPNPPTMQSLVYADGKVEGRWDGMAYATGYKFRLVRADSKEPIGGIQTTPFSVTSATVDFPSNESPGMFHGQSRSLHKDFKSAWGKPKSISKLPAPTITGLAVSNGQIVISWKNVPGNKGYRVRLVDAKGASVGEPTSAAQNATSISIDPASLPSGTYRAQARTRGSEIPADWSPPSTPTIDKLAAPTIREVEASRLKISATWSAVTGNGGYKLELLRPDDKMVAASAVTRENVVEASASLPTNSPSGTYRARVRTLGGSPTNSRTYIPSAWSASVQVAVGQAGPIPSGFSPTISPSAGDLINTIFNVHGENPQLQSGQFNAASSTITGRPVSNNKYYEVSFGPRGVYTANHTVVCCANVKLVRWDWRGPKGSPAGTRSVWTAGGWKVMTSGEEHLDQAVNLGGLYFYRIELIDQQVSGDRVAVIRAQERPIIAFLTRVTASRTGLFPGGFAPILDTSYESFIEKVFHSAAGTPRINSDCHLDRVTASFSTWSRASVGMYEINFGLRSYRSLITNTVIGCSTVELTDWSWFFKRKQSNAPDGKRVGARALWTAKGWKDVPNHETLPGGAVSVAGLYFYKIVLDKVAVLSGSVSCRIYSREKPRVSFFTAVHPPRN